MAILVTGGAGYIGSHCVAALIERGADVVVVDDLSKGHREALKGGRLYVGSVADRAFLDDVFSREPIEAVIHFAAFSLVGESMQVPEQYFRNNVTAGLTLIETMLAHKVPYLVFSSTAATFGEPEYVPIDEAHPQNPTNPYGESKLIVEKMLKWCDLAHGLKFCALRYFNVAGAWHDGSIGEDHRPESHLIPLILQVAQGKREQLSLFGTDYPTKDGTCIRDYIHVVDLAQGHVAAVQYAVRHKGTEIFDLGTGRGSSVLEMVNTFMVATGAQVPYEITGRRAGDIAVCYADPTKSREILGWTAQKTLADMCRDSWNWQSKNPMGYDS